MSFLRSKSGIPHYVLRVSLRVFGISLVLLGCAAAEPELHGASRVAADVVDVELQPHQAMREAASESTIVVGEGSGAWRARLAADGTARRLGDNRPGRWRVDDYGRLCTSFDDGTRGCWRVARDGASDPTLRGPGGQRARLEPAEQRGL
jgi:hypothetical protein